jgi:hypothetical protein
MGAPQRQGFRDRIESQRDPSPRRQQGFDPTLDRAAGSDRAAGVIY